MNRWSALTLFASIGPGTDVLIFEVTMIGNQVKQICRGDELRITLGEPRKQEVITTVVDVCGDAVVFATSDAKKWRMTPRRP